MELVIDFRVQRITLKGSDDQKVLEVLAMVKPMLSLFEVRIVPGGSEVVPDFMVDSAPAPVGAPAVTQTMREFAKAVDPASIPDKIATVAYYATFKEGRKAFSPGEMTEWFRVCGFDTLPKHMSVYLYDANRKAQYVANSERGQWKITPDGENRVKRLMERVGLAF